MELGAELPLFDRKTPISYDICNRYSSFSYSICNHDPQWGDKIPILDLDLENFDLADLADGKVGFVSLLSYIGYRLTD